MKARYLIAETVNGIQEWEYNPKEDFRRSPEITMVTEEEFEIMIAKLTDEDFIGCKITDKHRWNRIKEIYNIREL